MHRACDKGQLELVKYLADIGGMELVMQAKNVSLHVHVHILTHTHTHSMGLVMQAKDVRVSGRIYACVYMCITCICLCVGHSVR